MSNQNRPDRKLELGVGIIAIPDGVGEDNSLRISLVVAPSASAKTQVDLANWPAAIKTLCGASTVTDEAANLRLHLFDDHGQAASPPEGLKVQLHRSIRLASVADNADQIWRDLFPQGPNSQLDILYDILTKPQQKEQKPEPKRTWHYRAGEIAELYSQMRSACIGPTLLARIVGSEKEKEWASNKVTAADTKIFGSVRKPFRFQFERTLQNAVARSFVAPANGEPSFRLRYPDPDKKNGVQVIPVDVRKAAAQRQRQRNQRFVAALTGHALAKTADEKALTQFTDISPAERGKMVNTLLLGASYGAPPASGGVDFAGDNEELDHRIAQSLRLQMAFAAADFSGAFGPARGAPALETERAIDASGLKEGIQAKFDGLLSHPTLAKVLNFIVDIRVSVSAATLPASGYLRVDFTTETLPGPCVAYVLDKNKNIFRPGSRNELKLRTESGAPQELGLPLQDGFVRLDLPRFKLASTDVHSIVNATQVKMNELNSAQISSADNRDVSARQVEERSRGIQLVDDDARNPILTNLLAEPKDGDAVYAETLSIGYRVFVRRKLPSGTTGPWRTLMARSVRYDAIGEHYRARPGERVDDWSPMLDEREREREHGAVRPLPREEVQDAAGNKRVVAPSHVFTWNGDSLGVPAPQDNTVDCKQSEMEHLHIGFGKTYGYAADDRYRWPALRVGSSYEFGLAPVYLHGGGPTLADAASALAMDGALVIGQEGNKPGFMFGRASDVQAPVVLLAPHDRLVTDRPRPRNDQVDRVVLRTGAREDTDRVVRYLAPPRVDFTIAEQYGVFDHTNVATGAFSAFELDRDTGDFQSIEKPAASGRPDRMFVLRPRRHEATRDSDYYPDPAARNLGLAFERDEACAPGFPDVLPPLAFWPVRKDGGAQASLDARPIKLAFQRWPQAQSGGRVTSFSDGAQSGAEGDQFPGLTVQLAPAEEVNLWTWCRPDFDELLIARPGLGFQLALGFAASGTALAKRWNASAANMKVDRPTSERIEKEIGSWGLTGAASMGAWALHQHFRQLAGAPVNKESSGAMEPTLVDEVLDLIEDLMLRRVPLNGVTGWHKIVLVHAVAKPREIPSIPYVREGETGRLDFQVIRLLPGVTMSQYLGGARQPEPGAGQVGGTKMFFAGRIKIDRASTRSLRVEANWPLLDYEHAVVKEDVEGKPGRKRFVDRPPRIDRVLFDLSDIPRNGGLNGDDFIDLLRDEVGRLRELQNQSDSAGTAATAACELDLRLVATSRFSNDFEPDAPGRPASQLGKFEVETRGWVGPGAAPLKKHEEHRYKVMVLANVRPPPPVVTRIEWTAPERRVRLGSEHLLVTKRFVPRIFIDNSHRVTGEHELVGVAFLPAGAIREVGYVPGAAPIETPSLRTRVLPEYADEFARFTARPDGGVLPADYCTSQPDSSFCVQPKPNDLQFVTRWGNDPATGAMGRVEALMSPARFSGHVAAVSCLPMPLPETPGDEGGKPAALEVGVLLYKPKLDPDTGSWYIDIDIDPGAVHAPFVRLALVRYQPYALRGKGVDLRISAPLLLDPFRVPAPRTVEVRHPHGEPISADVYGVGYLRREPFGVNNAVRHLTDTPLQNMELKRYSETATGGLVQAFTRDGDEIRCDKVQPELAGPVLRWRGQFAPHDSMPRQRFALVIDEIEMHVPDAVLDRAASVADAPKEVHGVDDLVERPSFFSITIDLND